MSSGWLPGINKTSGRPVAVQNPVTIVPRDVMSVGRTQVVVVNDRGTLTSLALDLIELLSGYDPLITWSLAIDFASNAIGLRDAEVKS